MEITYTTSDCRLGRLLIASTQKGICMIAVGKTDAELDKRLHSEFADSIIKHNDRAMRKTRRSIEDRIAGKGFGDKLPVDLHGTPFQLAVWNEMLRIPPGTTRSYGEVARRIGKPNAFRAVARACGANPVPIVVPCHRVVASGGKLGGYTGGLDRKLALLASEGVSNPKWRAD